VTSWLGSIQLQADVLSFVVGLGTLLVSTYIAITLHRLSRRFAQNEATRSINAGWDSFHNAMLNAETHDLFWNWMRSNEKFEGIGERAHHVVLMYLNNVHTEYHTWRRQIFPDYDLTYLQTLLRVFADKREDVISLTRASGYEDEFINFLQRHIPAPSTPPQPPQISAQSNSAP
jgi:hypothetical protein